MSVLQTAWVDSAEERPKTNCQYCNTPLVQMLLLCIHTHLVPHASVSALLHSGRPRYLATECTPEPAMPISSLPIDVARALSTGALCHI